MCILCTSTPAELAALEDTEHLVDWIFITHCPAVTVIPAMPRVKNLYIAYCCSVTRIESCARLVSLECIYLPLLVAIAPMPQLQELELNGLPALPTIQPVLDATTVLGRLRVRSCSALAHLSLPPELCLPLALTLDENHALVSVSGDPSYAYARLEYCPLLCGIPLSLRQGVRHSDTQHTGCPNLRARGDYVRSNFMQRLPQALGVLVGQFLCGPAMDPHEPRRPTLLELADDVARHPGVHTDAKKRARTHLQRFHQGRHVLPLPQVRALLVRTLSYAASPAGNEPREDEPSAKRPTPPSPV